MEKMKTNETPWSRAQGPQRKNGAKDMASELTIGAPLAAELMVGFWFAVGAILAVKIMNGLDYCIEELISRKQNGRRKISNQCNKNHNK